LTAFSQPAVPDRWKTPTLRDSKTQEAFRRAALDNGIQICSLAIGSPGRSRLPLHTSPAAAILLTEAVEVAHNLGTNNILLPILGDSHIDMTNQTQVDTFVATMKEVARYAERFGVVVAVEDWISAEDNIRLLDAIGSDHVAVYYDAHNIVPRVKDIYAEPKLLGTRIHQIHVKNANMLLSARAVEWTWPADGEGVLRHRLPWLVRPRDRLADEGHHCRHPGQHRVREEDLPRAAASGVLNRSCPGRARHVASDHFDGRRFFNPTGPASQPFAAVPRMLREPRTRWPARIDEPPQRPAPLDGAVAVVTFIGHATFLIQTAAGNFLTDPMYSDRAGPFGLLGPRRVRQPAVRFDDLPAISTVLLSHNHYDHCDRPTLARLASVSTPS
jgi:hypothetical protein